MMLKGNQGILCSEVAGFNEKWTSDCKSVDEVCELFAMDRLLKIMPKQIAIKVKEKKPNALETAAEWADDIWESLEWRYEVVPSKDKGRLNVKAAKQHEITKKSTTSKFLSEFDAGKVVRQESDTAKGGRVIKERSAPKSNIRCYGCHKMGHYKSKCPHPHKSEEVHLLDASKESLVDLDKAPSRLEQKKAFIKATQNPVIIPGNVNGLIVDSIYLDPGASKTFVKVDWVDKNKMNGKVVEVKTINTGEQTYPVAPISIEVAGYKTDLEVAVHSSLPYDVLLGRNFPYLWEVGFREVNLASCNMVKSRQQKKLEDNMGCNSDSPSKIDVK